MEKVQYQNAQAVLSSVAEWSGVVGEGVALAVFAGFNADGHFMIRLGKQLNPVPALSTVSFQQSEVGTQIVVAFEHGVIRRPVIIGRLQEEPAKEPAPMFKVDSERVVLQAEREIELRCGDASIVLTRAGKVLIHGNFVMTRSRGANKIKGAYVDIN